MSGGRGVKYALGRFLRAFGIIYIALIGVFAIEELQRREKVLATINARERELGADLATLGSAQGDQAIGKRASLESEARILRALRVRTTALILGGAVHTANGIPGTVKAILCEYSATASAEIRCGGSDAKWWSARELAATAVLKRAAEQRSSGDVFAVLIIVAAVGGALIRFYLPGEEESDWFRKVFRAIGGGTVCYLALAGGSVPFEGTDMHTFTSPPTAALLGLLSGMFSTKVFKLLSDLVDSWMDRVTPARSKPSGAKAATPAGPGSEGSSKPSESADA
ncbi:MAG: hypothetical protein U0263_35360 [Polyangiaceae bacterium]